MNVGAAVATVTATSTEPAQPALHSEGFTSVEALILVAIIASLIVLAFLAAAEVSLNRISRVKAAALADSTGSKSAQALHRLVESPERFINPLLVTVTVLQMGQAFLTSIFATRLFGAVGAVVGFVLNVVVFFLLTEAMPKTWAVQKSERAALMAARPVEALVSFPPLRLISRGLIGLTNILVPGKGLKQGPFVSEQELLGIVGAAAEDEVIEDDERELIESIIEFGDTVAREVMVPRPDMLIIANDATVTDALDFAIANGVSRLPVFAADGEDVVGLAYIKDLIGAEREGNGASAVLDLARPVHFIPENKPVRKLMREMQAGKFHLAIVADEYGGVAGLVTLEDCLEELVGEIVDEYDVEESDVERQPNGDYLVSGSTPVEDLSDLLDLTLPDDDWDSVGGFVFGTLGHVPEVGEGVSHEGWRFTVAEIDGRRIRRVRVTYAPGADHGDGDTSDEADASENGRRGSRGHAEAQASADGA